MGNVLLSRCNNILVVQKCNRILGKSVFLFDNERMKRPSGDQRGFVPLLIVLLLLLGIVIVLAFLHVQRAHHGM